MRRWSAPIGRRVRPTGRLPGHLLGFALGGFFDGILLHQILQWHHLLSGVGAMDLRLQIAADGAFHLLMYVVAGIGLWQLWILGRRGGIPRGAEFCGHLLVGFGSWHILDGVASHWLLGIHRIRMDSETRLLWDLLWFAAFGLLPLMVGWWLGRNARPGPGRSVPAALTALLVVVAGLQALRPAGEARFTTVLFSPGLGEERIMAALLSLDARLVWRDASGEVVVLAPGPDAKPYRLFGRGALFVSGAGLPAGCFDKLRI